MALVALLATPLLAAGLLALVRGRAAGLVHGVATIVTAALGLVVTIVVVLLLCLGLRLFVDRRLFGLMVLVGAAVVLTVGIERIYVGAHYPSDVLGGFILAFSWLCFVIAVRPLSDHLIGIKALPATSPMTVQTNGTEATVREEVLVP